MYSIFIIHMLAEGVTAVVSSGVVDTETYVGHTRDAIDCTLTFS